MGLFNRNNKSFEDENNTEGKSEFKMSGKFIKGLEHMKNFSSQYLTIVSFAGIILGGYKVYDAWSDSNDQIKKSFEIIMSSQKEEEKRDSLLLEEQLDLRSDFEEHLKNSDEFVRQLQSLQKSYIRYIGNDDALTKNDFLKYMEGLSVDEKKNSSITGTKK